MQSHQGKFPITDQALEDECVLGLQRRRTALCALQLYSHVCQSVPHGLLTGLCRVQCRWMGGGAIVQRTHVHLFRQHQFHFLGDQALDGFGLGSNDKLGALGCVSFGFLGRDRG